MNPNDNTYYIIRGDHSGVFFGHISARDAYGSSTIRKLETAYQAQTANERS